MRQTFPFVSSSSFGCRPRAGGRGHSKCPKRGGGLRTIQLHRVDQSSVEGNGVIQAPAAPTVLLGGVEF